MVCRARKIVKGSKSGVLSYAEVGEVGQYVGEVGTANTILTI